MLQRTRRNEVEPRKGVREVRSKRLSHGILLPVICCVGEERIITAAKMAAARFFAFGSVGAEGAGACQPRATPWVVSTDHFLAP